MRSHDGCVEEKGDSGLGELDLSAFRSVEARKLPLTLAERPLALPGFNPGQVTAEEGKSLSDFPLT